MLSCRKIQKADSNNEEFLIKLYQDYYRLMFATARKYVSDFRACLKKGGDCAKATK